MPFQPDNPPDLTFTRPMTIELEGKSFDKGSLYWNPLLFELVRQAGLKGIKGDQLKQMLLCNFVDGEADATQGYRYIQGGRAVGAGPSRQPRLEDHLPPREDPRAVPGGRVHLGRQAQGRLPRQDRPDEVRAVMR
jgi:hypothetical protein